MNLGKDYGMKYNTIRALRWLGLMIIFIVAMLTRNINYFISGLLIMLMLQVWGVSDLLQLLTRSSVYSLNRLRLEAKWKRPNRRNGKQ